MHRLESAFTAFILFDANGSSSVQLPSSTNTSLDQVFIRGAPTGVFRGVILADAVGARPALFAIRAILASLAIFERLGAIACGTADKVEAAPVFLECTAIEFLQACFFGQSHTDKLFHTRLDTHTLQAILRTSKTLGGIARLSFQRAPYTNTVDAIETAATSRVRDVARFSNFAKTNACTQTAVLTPTTLTRLALISRLQRINAAMLATATPHLGHIVVAM